MDNDLNLRAVGEVVFIVVEAGDAAPVAELGLVQQLLGDPLGQGVVIQELALNVVPFLLLQLSFLQEKIQ